MSTIGRFYVEKKPGLDNEAVALFENIKESLQINELSGVRILNRYDIEGLDERFMGMVKTTVLTEPPVDVLYEEQFPIAADEKYFVKQYLPGQFDQCADSLIQCVQIISGEQNINAQAAKVYVLKGNLSEDELNRIAEYCYNPVDSRLGDKEKPKTLEMNLTKPEDIKTIDGFIDKTDEQIDAMRRAEGYAMSTKDLIHCRDYFAGEKRNPTVTEMKVIDTYWSDHCRHTTFLTELGDIKIDEGYYSEPIAEAYDTYLSERGKIYKDRKAPITLMDMAVMGMKSLRAKGLLDDLDISDEINACSINIEVDVDGKPEKWLLMFKNETHNHPTEIEPYGGAATCLGGAIRDPLSGRSYVYQAMRITGAGNVKTPVSETLKGKLPQRKITTEAAHGFSSYGNQIGLATGHVREIYDDGFVAKRMEIGAVIGAAPKRNVVREKPTPGDVVIVVGGRTGRDGCGGATGSSKEHSADSINDCGAEVQKGNAPTERKLQRLFRNGDVARLIKRCNDFGAGGVCVAIGELADSLTIDLDKVLKKYEGLDGTELAISESQERMAVVVSPDNIEKFIEYSEEENLEAVAVAEITDDGDMKMLWRGKEIVNIKRSFLDTNGAAQTATAIIKNPDKTEIIKSSEIFEGGIKKSFINAVSDMNACSQKGLVQRFDSTIGAATVLMPFGGMTQNSPEDVMAAKIPVLNGETSTASLMSAAYDPRIFKLSPFHGGIYAVVESVARLVAAGADHKKIRLSFQEYFEKMTENPYTWGKPAAALLGALKAELGLLTPSIGGKDSMSGTFGDMSVPPVLTSFAVAVEKTNRIIDVAFKGENNVYIFTPDYDKFDVVSFDSLNKGYAWFYDFSGMEKVFAASAVKRFGIAETVSKMCFGNEKGFEFDGGFISKHGEESLFMPLYGSIVFETTMEIDAENVELLGKTNNSKLIKINDEEIELDELVAAWERPLEKIFPTKITNHQKSANTFKSMTGKKTDEYEIAKGIRSYKKPRVFIPTFPGTNCEYDSARAFELAGAETSVFVFRNIKMQYIDESVKEMAKQIRNTQIIMIPGGFSAGDEPNGSAKFIASVFRNPYIKEAVNEHLTKNDGLILGICNGFQALIKLGLLPNGRISEITEDSPTIYYNEIGRHISQIVDTKVTSVNSPFLSGSKIGDIVKVAVSHGEGRFLIAEDMYKRLAENGQIASVYVDGQGMETMEPPYNPNGAMYAVEGLLSPCGRVFGKMGHNERMGIDVYKNVAGTADYNDNPYNSRIFESAVKYFL